MPTGLQPVSFNHSDIPPSVSEGECRAFIRPGPGKQWATSLDLEVGVFRTTEKDLRAPSERWRRDEPAPPVGDEHEEAVAAGAIEQLRHAVPALVPAAGAQGHLPSSVAKTRGRLDLHPQEPT